MEETMTTELVVIYLSDGRIQGVSYDAGDFPVDQTDLIELRRPDFREIEPAVVLGVGETRDKATKSFHRYWVRIKRIHQDDPSPEMFGHSMSEVEARSQVELPPSGSDDSETDFSGAEDHLASVRVTRSITRTRRTK